MGKNKVNTERLAKRCNTKIIWPIFAAQKMNLLLGVLS